MDIACKCHVFVELAFIHTYLMHIRVLKRNECGFVLAANWLIVECSMVATIHNTFRPKQTNISNNYSHSRKCMYTVKTKVYVLNLKFCFLSFCLPCRLFEISTKWMQIMKYSKTDLILPQMKWKKLYFCSFSNEKEVQLEIRKQMFTLSMHWKFDLIPELIGYTFWGYWAILPMRNYRISSSFVCNSPGMRFNANKE